MPLIPLTGTTDESLLLGLSHDSLEAISRCLADPLDPHVAVPLSAASRGLRAPICGATRLLIPSTM